jgi:uncharacterized repeat protein (TIGR03803 family)
VRKFSWRKTMFFACVFCGAAGISSSAQTLTTVVNFDITNGAFPNAVVTQGTDGNFYGTTTNGGPNTGCPAGSSGCGTVFKMTATGTLTTLYSFCSQPNCADGWAPYAGLVQGTDGNLYGTTSRGGIFSSFYGGTVFKITPAGVLTTLYSFCSEGVITCSDGFYPSSVLVQGTDGNFYGTTEFGGYSTYCTVTLFPNGCGTVFMVTPTGSVETTIYSFCSQPNCADGFNPVGGVVQASNGNFYGTTLGETFFEITPGGALTTLHTFEGGVNAEYPMSPLVQASNGNFYGTTEGGGANGYGTVFEITPGGSLTRLYSFCSQPNCADGGEPMAAGVVQASDGNFYGTTFIGGTIGAGTVFEITPGGSLTTLYSFCSQPNCIDGSAPTAGVMQASNGNFYGTTNQGGTSAAGICSPSGCGTIFSLPGPVKVPVSETECNGAYNGTFHGNILISSGETCEFSAGGVTGNITMTGGTLILANASIGGNVQIQGGGSFTLGPSLTIMGDLQIQNLPEGTPNMICGANVIGSLQFQNNRTAVQIGYQSSCAGNRIGGSLQVGNNSASTWLFNNTVTDNLQDQNNDASTAIVGNSVRGNLQVQNNAASTQVSNNTVSNNLQCQNNRSIIGGGNTAKQKQGQCGGF